MNTISKDNMPDWSVAMPKETVDLATFGIERSIIVRALTQAEEREAMKFARAEDAELNAYVASVACIDETGQALFKRETLQSFPGKMVRHLAEVSMKLSGIMEGEAGNEPSG